MRARIPPRSGAGDVAAGFRWTPKDAILAEQLLKREGTPEAISHFAANCEQLTDYGYWFMLSTLWVSYTGFSDLGLWKRLLSSPRPGRTRYLMKPSEYQEFRRLPPTITAYRVHRPAEEDWISYTLDVDTAIRIAAHRKAREIVEYLIPHREVVALFLRRGEHEIIVLDKDRATLTRRIPVEYTEE